MPKTRSKQAAQRLRWRAYLSRLRRLRRKVKKAQTLAQIKGCYTFREIACAVGLRRNNLHAIFKGKHEPKLRIAVRISRFLNIRTEDFADYLEGLRILKMPTRRGREPGKFKAHEMPSSGLDPTIATW